MNSEYYKEIIVSLNEQLVSSDTNIKELVSLLSDNSIETLESVVSLQKIPNSNELIVLNGVQLTRGETSDYLTYTDESNSFEYSVYIPPQYDPNKNTKVLFVLEGANESKDPNASKTNNMLNTDYESDEIIVFVRNSSNDWKTSPFVKNKDDIGINFIKNITTGLNSNTIDLAGHSAGERYATDVMTYISKSDLESSGIHLDNVYLMSCTGTISKETGAWMKENNTNVYYIDTSHESTPNGQGLGVLKSVWGSDWKSHYLTFDRSGSGTTIKHDDVIYETFIYYGIITKK